MHRGQTTPAATALHPSRREVLAGAGAALTASLALPAQGRPAALSLATGRVVEHGASRRGVPGVMVSNGRDVTLTDRDGAWSLPRRGVEPIFVVKPSGWSTPLGRGGVPAFAAAATGAPIEFVLRRTPEPDAFDVLLFADTQPANATELGYVRDAIVAAALGHPAAFGIHHGDVVGDDLSLYSRYLDILGATHIPWHHCPGNHDRDPGATDQAAAFATWRRTFGPAHYAFEYGPATFLVLNSVTVDPDGAYRGALGAEQLEFVANVLRSTPRERLVVLSMHVPLASYDAPDGLRETTADRRALLALLSDRPHTVSFAGHSHTTEHHYLGRAHGFDRERPHHHHVLTAASGSWWGGLPDEHGIPSAVSRDGSPKGFHILSIAGTGYETRFVPVSASRDGGMRLMLAGRAGDGLATGAATGSVLGCPVSAAALCNASLVVDVFDGGPRTRLAFEVEGSSLAPFPLERTAIPDPHVVAAFARAPQAYRSWVAPALSSHVWSAPLPGTLAPGCYRLVVRGSDEFGRPISGRMVLDVLA